MSQPNGDPYHISNVSEQNSWENWNSNVMRNHSFFSLFRDFFVWMWYGQLTIFFHNNWHKILDQNVYNSKRKHDINLQFKSQPMDWETWHKHPKGIQFRKKTQIVLLQIKDVSYRTFGIWWVYMFKSRWNHKIHRHIQNVCKSSKLVHFILFFMT